MCIFSILFLWTQLIWGMYNRYSPFSQPGLDRLWPHMDVRMSGGWWYGEYGESSSPAWTDLSCGSWHFPQAAQLRKVLGLAVCFNWLVLWNIFYFSIIDMIYNIYIYIYMLTCYIYMPISGWFNNLKLPVVMIKALEKLAVGRRWSGVHGQALDFWGSPKMDDVGVPPWLRKPPCRESCIYIYGYESIPI